MWPFLCMVSTYLFIACTSWVVGSPGICVYMFVSAKCCNPSCMYLVLSSTTMHEPLSAFFITMSVLCVSSLSAFHSVL